MWLCLLLADLSIKDAPGPWTSLVALGKRSSPKCQTSYHSVPIGQPCFFGHFVSWSRNVRHILGSIARVVYWKDMNRTILVALPGWDLQAKRKKKSEVNICPREEQLLGRIRFLTVTLPWDRWGCSSFSAELWTQQGLLLGLPLSSKADTKNDCGSSHINLGSNCTTLLCLYIQCWKCLEQADSWFQNRKITTKYLPWSSLFEQLYTHLNLITTLWNRYYQPLGPPLHFKKYIFY